jgi:hypothetical protein
MGQVEFSVRGVVLVFLGLRVAAHVITIIITAIAYLTIASYAQSATAQMVQHAIASTGLCACRHHQRRHCHQTEKLSHISLFLPFYFFTFIRFFGCKITANTAMPQYLIIMKLGHFTLRIPLSTPKIPTSDYCTNEK